MFRTIVVGGQQPPAGRPANVVATYGMTETGSGVVYDGVGLEGVEVSLRSGEVWLRCPMLLRCYRDGTDPKTADGWFATGDAGELDGDGRLSIQGRLDELVISGGENIWPAQVEAVLRRHPCGARGRGRRAPGPEVGRQARRLRRARRPKCKALEPATILAELRELVKQQLAPFAAPRAHSRRAAAAFCHRQGQPRRAGDPRRPSRGRRLTSCPCRIWRSPYRASGALRCSTRHVRPR